MQQHHKVCMFGACALNLSSALGGIKSYYNTIYYLLKNFEVTENWKPKQILTTAVVYE